jgi:lysophospholipase L1-like esterase
MTLRQLRGILANAVELLRDQGDRNVHYLDGLNVLSVSDVVHSDDGLHPNGAGYQLMV